MEEKRDGRKWENMNTDCLVCIFQKLGIKDMTVAVPFVCQSWYKASLDPLCWRVLDFGKLNFMPGSRFSTTVTLQYQLSRFSFSAFLKFAIRRSCGMAAELRFPSSFQFSIHDLAYATDECPRLRILDLRDFWSKDEVHIPKLVGKLKELERLEMESKPTSFADLAAEIGINCVKFTGLRMSGAITKEDASAIAEYLPKLKFLKLSSSYLPRSELIAILDGCKELETLIVNVCKGFRGDDEEVTAKANGIKIFERYGSMDRNCKTRLL